jgi:hypothetical protein
MAQNDGSICRLFRLPLCRLLSIHPHGVTGGMVQGPGISIVYMKIHHVQTGVGHYGVFNGQRWSNEIYPLVREIIQFSG